MNHFVHFANAKSIYFEKLENASCKSSLIIFPPGLTGCNCENLLLCGMTQSKYNGFYTVLRFEPELWSLDDPCELPLLLDGKTESSFQNRSLLRNDKIVQKTNILRNLDHKCFDSNLHRIETYRATSLIDCSGICRQTKSCVAYTYINLACEVFNTITRMKSCNGTSNVILERYRCEKLT
eukprot:NODE_23_length_42016_cov_0.755803.p24 type:complete len:180 gc:universal NODE_23_length_42016_cov_0.755803:36309-36848(+)